MTRASDPVPAAPSRPGAARALQALAVAALLPLAAPAVQAAPPSSTPGTAAPHGTAPTPARPAAGQDGDAGSRSVAARARMNECGHQWNNMKRAGTASGTWKDFSRNCLAQK